MPDDPIPAILDQLAAHADRIRQLDQQRAADLTRITAMLETLASTPRPDDDEAETRAPNPARRWWQLTGDDRDRAISGLRAWVEGVYRPGYGQLAMLLGPCWDQHPLCLYGVDILAELWSVLYLTTRTPAILSAQAEFQARILPALADQMAAETRHCPHARPRPSARTTP